MLPRYQEKHMEEWMSFFSLVQFLASGMRVGPHMFTARMIGAKHESLPRFIFSKQDRRQIPNHHILIASLEGTVFFHHRFLHSQIVLSWLMHRQLMRQILLRPEQAPHRRHAPCHTSDRGQTRRDRKS